MAEPRTEEQVIETYKKLQQELEALSANINEFEAKVQEHTLVLKTLEPLDPNRKCFRLIGGVLVEQNVGLVKPVTQSNLDNLKAILESFTSQLETRRKAFLDFQNKYKIRAVSSPEEAEALRSQQQQQSSNQQGVLVSKS